MKTQHKVNGGLTLDADAIAGRLMRAPAVGAALMRAAETVRAAALSALNDGIAPDTRSGALAQSLSIEQLPDGRLSVGSDAPHAWYAEFGTRDGAETGWLSRAARNVLPGVNGLSRTVNNIALRQSEFEEQQTGASA